MTAEWGSNCVFLSTILRKRHAKLFTELTQILTTHAIVVRLLQNAKDQWATDYCPIQVGPGKLVKFLYNPNYLKGEPGLTTGDEIVKSFEGFGHCQSSKIILDGGNVVKSQDRAILTDKIYKENPGWNRAKLRDELQRLLLVDELIVIPKEPYDPIGHADAMVRFVDEDTVLVNDYSAADQALGDRLFKVLRQHKLVIETLPYYYEKLSIAGIPSAVGCYINYLRTEKVLITPVFGNDNDAVAVSKLETVFPEIPVIPINCTNLAREGGVLNCVAATYRI